MSVTINDVARHAGVSIKTVSRVINNESSVRPATFEKVMLSVKTLNYRPNNSARSLAGTRSYTIAFIYDNPNAYYVIAMQQGLLDTCRADNYELLIHPCDHRSETVEEEIRNFVQQARIAGVVLTPPFSEMPGIPALLNELGLPNVRIISASAEQSQTDGCICIDDHTAAFNITQHLIELGHRKIGFLCGGEEHLSTGERLNGYLAALEKNKIRPSKQLIIGGDYSFESGVKGAQKLLARRQRPTAIFASNDEMAAGALFASRLEGVTIPQELSIAGFEDSPFSRQTWPKLTTAHQPNELIASQAARLLLGKIKGKSDADLLKRGLTHSFCPELIVRDSTAKASLAPVDDRKIVS